MPLIKRLGYFFIGLSLGIIFLTFFLKGKNAEFCYLPDCRVLKDIRKKEIIFSPEINQLIDNKTITKETIIDILNNGDVLFSKSDTEARPCKKYVIEGMNNDNTVELSIDNCMEKAVVKSIAITQ